MICDDRTISNLLHWLAGLDGPSFERVRAAVDASAILRGGAAPAEPWRAYGDAPAPEITPKPLGSRLDVTG
jgi:hypothetical protein